MKKTIMLSSIGAVLILILAACSSSAPTPVKEAMPTESVSGKSANVEMSNFAFNPAELTVRVGTTVTWTNKDSASHDVKASDASWGSESLSQGQSFSMVFDKEGTYDYVCTFHPGMQGKIIVTK